MCICLCSVTILIFIHLLFGCGCLSNCSAGRRCFPRVAACLCVEVEWVIMFRTFRNFPLLSPHGHSAAQARSVSFSSISLHNPPVPLRFFALLLSCPCALFCRLHLPLHFRCSHLRGKHPLESFLKKNDMRFQSKQAPKSITINEKTGFGRCPKDWEDVQKIRSLQRGIMRKP